MANKKNFPASLIDSIKECKTPEELAVLIKLASKTIILEKDDELTIVAVSVNKAEELQDLGVRLESFVYAHSVEFT